MHLLEILRGARVGIDASHYIARVMPPKSELLIDAVGGLPHTIASALKRDLAKMKAAQITPVFVLPGVRTKSQHAYEYSRETDELVARARSDAWATYYAEFDRQLSKGAASPIGGLPFKSQPYLAAKSYMADFAVLLRQLGVEHITAPYASWAQLAYLSSQGYVDAVYGPTECLFSKLERFLVAFEFQSGEFRYIDHRLVMEELRLPERAFREIAVAVSCDIQPDRALSRDFAAFGMNPDAVDFKWLYDAVQSGMVLQGLLLASSKKNGTDMHLNNFKSALAAIEFCPIMREDGRVVLPMEPQNGFVELTPENSERSPEVGEAPKPRVPSDVHSVVSLKLPHEYYFYHSVGLLLTRLLNTLSHAVYIECRPLDGGITSQYHSMVQSNTAWDLRNRTLNLLTSGINRYFQNQKVMYVPYVGSPRAFDFKMPRPLFWKLSHYYVRGGKSFDFAGLIANLGPDFLATVDHETGQLSGKDVLRTEHELLSTGLMRALYLYDFVLLSDNSLSQWGRALAKIKVLKPEYFERILLLFVILKMFPEVKLGSPFTPGGGVSFLLGDQSKWALIITRLALLYPVPEQQISSGYDLSSLKKLNRNFLAFRSALELARRQFSETLQAGVVSVLVNGQFNRPKIQGNAEWRKIATKMPLAKELDSTVMALAVDAYLECSINGSNAVETVQTAFAEYSNDMKGLLKGAFGFVGECLDALLQVEGTDTRDFANCKEFLKKWEVAV